VTKTVYPTDFYSSNGVQYYGTGEPAMDRRTWEIINSHRGKQNSTVTIYRAVPNDTSHEVLRYENEKRFILKTGKLPDTADNSGMNSSKYYEYASNKIAELQAGKQSTINAINPGDWVTINRAYAKEHGEGALRGHYQIISKVVKAKDLYTNGDSMHEWGWDPK
jgi:hypothetical protein